MFLIHIQEKMWLQESIKGKIFVISPIQIFLLFCLKYLIYEKKRYSLIIQGRKLQVKLAQLVLRSILTYVSSLAFTLDE